MTTHNLECFNQPRQTLLDAFCTQENLPETYKILAQQYFFPLADEIIHEQKASHDNKKAFIQTNETSTQKCFLQS